MAWLDGVAPWWARRKAAKDLPDAARRLGLPFSQGKSKGEIGTICGTYAGHEVLIEPDHPKIVVNYRARKDGIGLSTWSLEDLRHREVNFDSGNRSFDRLLKKRLLAKEWQDKLSGHPPFFDEVVAFRRKWCRVVSQLDFNVVHFSVCMKIRWDTIRYISAADLSGMLPEMIRIVDIFEEALASVAT